jgi:hypothetical protein
MSALIEPLLASFTHIMERVWTDEWMDGYMDAWMNGYMDRWMHG